MFKNSVTDVFFDLDHTLWDFEKNSALTFAKILTENKVEVELEVFLEVYSPINFQMWALYRENKITKSALRYQRLRLTFDKLGAEVSDEIIDVLAHEYIEHLSSFTHLLPNSLEILDYLSPKYRLHIITNGFQEVQEKKMKGSQIHHYFEIIVNSEMAGVKKPHPQIFELALTEANVHPKNSIMIGDNLEADILGAKAMGMQVVHYNSNGEPDHSECVIVNDLIEIKNLL
ncbi:YjjG family noncanonical pyrimidine nucleotidase [Flagellimonas zhangzhouensis]|uniref:Putative hydrolase of the HAD superfamily n=1 Tax=Flagellimonas zhangzhouensis TaxID=1073328 RepID=A0A1H2Q6R0_9FLAO|nr:YjjG family noncanonical pyrimidine nucleotidase [Allomuricauda zhangzhouensis]SDQ48328.1 putative hydrolase of the HAD superfamily [Allomuricauda zhangzhouensis]SDW02109.1 putative hydrolase of the HAD superfamily [Allomuricauda zhangzhouensis]